MHTDMLTHGCSYTHIQINNVYITVFLKDLKTFSYVDKPWSSLVQHAENTEPAEY